MALSKSEKLALDDLIARGDLIGAQNLLAGKAGTPPVEAPPASEPTEPPPPRAPLEILHDLASRISDSLGNNPALSTLVAELRAALDKA